MHDHAFCKFSFINSLIKTFFHKTVVHKPFFHKACFHKDFFLKACFHKTLFLKTCFGPLVLVHTVRFCHNTMPVGLSLLKISHRLSSSQPSLQQSSLLTLFYRCPVELKTIRWPFTVVFFLYLIWRKKTETWQLSNRLSDLPFSRLPL